MFITIIRGFTFNKATALCNTGTETLLKTDPTITASLNVQSPDYGKIVNIKQSYRNIFTYFNEREENSFVECIRFEQSFLKRHVQMPIQLLIVENIITNSWQKNQKVITKLPNIIRPLDKCKIRNKV